MGESLQRFLLFAYAANACCRHSGIYNFLVIPSVFHNLGISNETSFSYPQTFHSVGISSKISFSYPQSFHSVGISNKTSFSYPRTFHSEGISSKTSFSYPQASHTHKLFTLRRKKGTGGRNSQVTHDTLPGAVLRKQRSLCAARTFSHRT